MGLVQMTLYAIGCLPSLSCPFHCVKTANRAQRGKASLVIGSRKNVSEAERNVLLFSRPLCRANSNHRQKGRAYPVYQYSQTQYHWNAWSKPIVVLRHYGFSATLVYVKILQNASPIRNISKLGTDDLQAMLDKTGSKAISQQPYDKS